MKPLLRFSLGQTVFINLIFVLLMVVGVFAVFDLPVERYPNVHMGKVVINAFLPGASPSEVETLVTSKIEESLEDLKNVEYVRSRSFRQRASILVKFLDDTDYAAGYDEIRFKVLSIQNDLPADMDPPTFTEVNVNEWLPVVTINLVGDRSNRALTLMAEELQTHLEQIEGVQEVEINGEFTREFHVNLDPGKMMRYGVTFDQVASALDAANISFPAGDFESDSGEYVIVVDEKFRTREQVAGVVVRRDADGSFVTVGDVIAHAGLSYRDPFVTASVNGKDAVSIKIIKTWDGNALDIVEEVEAVTAAFEPKLAAEGVDAVLTQDQRIYIQDALSTLGSNMIVGIVLVTLVIWLVMGFRNAMLTTVGIPFSFLVTMIIMWLTGNSLNEITLFSFVLVSGIIVDDAIVVVENIFRHVQEGLPLREAVVSGTAEVFLPVVAATSTTVAAFLPMLIMTGSTGEFFALVPKAVTFAIIASLVECLIILPPHFLEWPGRKRLKAGTAKAMRDPRFMEGLRNLAERMVSLTLRFRFTSLLLVFSAFAVALFILVVSVTGKMPLLRIQFFPDDYNLFYVEVEGPVATPIHRTADKLKAISDHLTGMGPEMVKSTTGLAGFYFNEDYEEVFGSNLGHVAVELPAKDNQRFPDAPENDPLAYLEFMRRDLAPFAEGGWTLRIRAEQGGPPAGKDVNIRVLGTNHQAVRELVSEVYAFLASDEANAPYLLDLTLEEGVPNRIFRFHPLPERIAEYDLTPARVAVLAGSILDGRFVGKFRLADEEVDLRLKIDSGQLETPEQALDIPVLEDPTGPIRLGDLARVSSSMEPGQLNRFQGQRAIAITANLAPGAPVSSTSVVNDVRTFYRSIQDDYPGATINFSGEYEDTRRSYTSLTYAFLIAVLVIYLILATQFKSYTQPVIILSAVIFSLTGVVFGTFVTQTLFTVNSFIATVGVTGVVVNDSLVLLDFINRRYASGLSRREAIREGVRIRLRPILLTTLTTTLGLLPMAIGFPSYSLVWGTMATTFVTGLCTATFLTIFIVPVEWDLLTALHERMYGKKKSPAQAAGDNTG